MASEPLILPGTDADLSGHAHRTVREILVRHGGPSDCALLDMLWAYTASSPAGRDHLFLVVAARAVGKPYEPKAQASAHPDRGPSPRTSARADDHLEPALPALGSLALVPAPRRQVRS